MVRSSKLAGPGAQFQIELFNVLKLRFNPTILSSLNKGMWTMCLITAFRLTKPMPLVLGASYRTEF